MSYNDKRKVGYINEDSDIVIAPKYEVASNFNNGIASIAFNYSTGNDKSKKQVQLESNASEFLYINENGSIIKELSEYRGDSFFDGTAEVEKRKNLDIEFEIYPNGKNYLAVEKM